MPSNRTPTEVIASVEQWASHALTQPNDPMRKDVAAVLAMATAWVLLDAASGDHDTMQDQISADDKWSDASDAVDSALAAAGVEVKA